MAREVVASTGIAASLARKLSVTRAWSERCKWCERAVAELRSERGRLVGDRGTHFTRTRPYDAMFNTVTSCAATRRAREHLRDGSRTHRTSGRHHVHR